MIKMLRKVYLFFIIKKINFDFIISFIRILLMKYLIFLIFLKYFFLIHRVYPKNLIINYFIINLKAVKMILYYQKVINFQNLIFILFGYLD